MISDRTYISDKNIFYWNDKESRKKRHKLFWQGIYSAVGRPYDKTISQLIFVRLLRCSFKDLSNDICGPFQMHQNQNSSSLLPSDEFP